MSAYEEMQQYLAAQLQRIERERQKNQEVRTCYECGGSGVVSYYSPVLSVCQTCLGQKMIVVTD
mgnify:FL=1